MVTPTTITMNADGSVLVVATVSHFTVFGLFRQPSPAWTGVLPQANVSFVVWRGFTGTDPATAAALATSNSLGIWRLDTETRRIESWIWTSPAFANSLTSLVSGDFLFVRTRAAAPLAATPSAHTSTPPTITTTTSAGTTPGGTTSSSSTTHTVTSADTLTIIGARLGVNWLQIAAANGISGPQYIISPGQVLIIPRTTVVTTGGAATRTHTVTATDKLSALGALYGVDWLAIAAPNGITGPQYFIQPGQVLAIPAPSRLRVADSGQTHLVVAGNTLSTIAQRYGVPTLTLAEANNLTPPLYIVRTGQVLQIP